MSIAVPIYGLEAEKPASSGSSRIASSMPPRPFDDVEAREAIARNSGSRPGRAAAVADDQCTTELMSPWPLGVARDEDQRAKLRHQRARQGYVESGDGGN